MPVSPQRLTMLASQTGFIEQTLEKVLRLGDILADFERHPLLSRVLVLKGGTAINLCFGEPRRLSVDLDFNYVGSVEREAMLEARPEIERAIATVVAAQGYALQRSADEHAGRKLFLNYINAGGTRDRVEIDLNYLHRIPIDEPETRQLWQPGDADRPSFHVVGAQELWIGKICALLDRGAPRDAFDIGLLPDSVRGSPRFDHLFVAMAGTLDRPAYTYGRDRLERLTDSAVREQLHPTLTAGDRPTSAELIAASWEKVGPMLDLDASQREYSDGLQRGNLRPDLLFPDDDDMVDVLVQHPALRWKVANARKRSQNPRSGAPIPPEPESREP